MTGGNFSLPHGNSPPPLAGEGQGGGSAGTAGYYDYPVVRRPVWTWEVPAYFWLGGLGAGAFVTASLAQTFGSADDRRIAADGFYVAAAALLPCAPLLIGDLGRPERFHHMLRIFKPLSPMNLGAWTLTGFTPLAFARAGLHAADTGLLRGPLRALVGLVPRRLTELTGCLLGLTLAGYSGVLLGATNVPLWAKSRLLGGVFMASALSSGSAAVTLQAARRGAPEATLHRLATVESAASLGEMAILTGYLVQSGKAARPLTTGRFAPPFWLGAVFAGGLLPLLLHGFARRGHSRTVRSLSTAAAMCSMIGSLALRWSIFEAGKDSSEDQSASFDLSKAGENLGGCGSSI
ncbi:MAG: polysulfide reductase [Chloroflexi bacterium]|nr:MAG: polysulfide reductase [Chloroflexota bacterium]